MAAAAPNDVDRAVTITSPAGKDVPSQLRVLEWTSEQRTVRAWKRLGMWWGGAVLGAFMPPHIPWFTIGLIGGPIAARSALKQGALIRAQDVACPTCGNASHVDEQPETWPLGARCATCRDVFWINPATPSAASV